MRSSVRFTAGFRRDGAWIGISITLFSVARSFSPANSRRPVSASCMTAPSANRSLRASGAAPATCSGDT
jgi:hypothetical protein